MNNVVTDPDDARILRACKLVNWTEAMRSWTQGAAPLPPLDLLQFADVVLSALAPKEHQHAPCPDYRMSEPAAEPVEICSCEEALALRNDLLLAQAEIALLRARAERARARCANMALCAGDLAEAVEEALRGE